MRLSSVNKRVVANKIDLEIGSFLTQHETESEARKNGRSRKKRRRSMGEIAFQTDVADLLIRTHGHNLRYVTGLGWLVWNGKVWECDDNERAHEAVKSVAKTLREEAAYRGGDEGQRLWTLARGVATCRGVKDVLGLAQSDERIRLTVNDLDARPHLLACLNGTIDLTTGELHPHEREHLLTRCAPIWCVPSAEVGDKRALS